MAEQKIKVWTPISVFWLCNGFYRMMGVSNLPNLTCQEDVYRVLISIPYSKVDFAILLLNAGNADFQEIKKKRLAHSFLHVHFSNLLCGYFIDIEDN